MSRIDTNHSHIACELRGKVARCCKTSRLGVITHQVQYFDFSLGKYQVRYVGFTLDNTPWESTRIAVIAHSLIQFYRSNP